ncbi:MAG TPA: lipocalin family protein [Chitinophagaceae bacterium]|jgi:Lipocalin-like domain
MKSIYTLCIACSVLLTFAGCKKSSDSKPKTKTEIISQSSWKIDNAKVSGIDVTSSLDACEIDNILTFSSNGTGTLDEGATKCDASDPQSNPFSWNFASNETMLHISTVVISGGSSDFTIVTLNDTQLVLSQDVDISGTTQTATISFKH